MARIYKTTDRIPVRIGEITVKIAPLSSEQKAEVQHYMLGFTRGDIRSATKGTALALKYAIKEISGVEDQDGKPYKLDFEGSILTDDCVSDLLNLEMSDKLVLVCSSLVGKVPSEFTDNEGKPLEGVEIIRESDEKKS